MSWKLVIVCLTWNHVVARATCPRSALLLVRQHNSLLVGQWLPVSARWHIQRACRLACSMVSSVLGHLEEDGQCPCYPKYALGAVTLPWS